MMVTTVYTGENDNGLSSGQSGNIESDVTEISPDDLFKEGNDISTICKTRILENANIWFQTFIARKFIEFSSIGNLNFRGQLLESVSKYRDTMVEFTNTLQKMVFDFEKYSEIYLIKRINGMLGHFARITSYPSNDYEVYSTILNKLVNLESNNIDSFYNHKDHDYFKLIIQKEGYYLRQMGDIALSIKDDQKFVVLCKHISEKMKITLNEQNNCKNPQNAVQNGSIYSTFDIIQPRIILMLKTVIKFIMLGNETVDPDVSTEIPNYKEDTKSFFRAFSELLDDDSMKYTILQTYGIIGLNIGDTKNDFFTNDMFDKLQNNELEAIISWDRFILKSTKITIVEATLLKFSLFRHVKIDGYAAFNNLAIPQVFGQINQVYNVNSKIFEELHQKIKLFLYKLTIIERSRSQSSLKKNNDITFTKILVNVGIILVSLPTSFDIDIKYDWEPFISREEMRELFFFALEYIYLITGVDYLSSNDYTNQIKLLLKSFLRKEDIYLIELLRINFSNSYYTIQVDQAKETLLVGLKKDTYSINQNINSVVKLISQKDYIIMRFVIDEDSSNYKALFNSFKNFFLNETIKQQLGPYATTQEIIFIIEEISYVIHRSVIIDITLLVFQKIFLQEKSYTNSDTFALYFIRHYVDLIVSSPKPSELRSFHLFLNTLYSKAIVNRLDAEPDKKIFLIYDYMLFIDMGFKRPYWQDIDKLKHELVILQSASSQNTKRISEIKVLITQIQKQMYEQNKDLEADILNYKIYSESNYESDYEQRRNLVYTDDMIIKKYYGYEFMLNFLDFFELLDSQIASNTNSEVNYYLLFFNFYLFLIEIRKQISSKVEDPYNVVLAILKNCMAYTASLEIQPKNPKLNPDYYNFGSADILLEMSEICTMSHRKYAEFYYLYIYYLNDYKKIGSSVSFIHPLENYNYPYFQEPNSHLRLFFVYAKGNIKMTNNLNELCASEVQKNNAFCISWSLFRKLVNFVESKDLVFNELAVSALYNEYSDTSEGYLRNVLDNVPWLFINAVDGIFLLKTENYDKVKQIIESRNSLTIRKKTGSGGEISQSINENKPLLNLGNVDSTDVIWVTKYLIRTFSKAVIELREQAVALAINSVLTEAVNYLGTSFASDYKLLNNKATDENVKNPLYFYFSGETKTLKFVKLFLMFATKTEHFAAVATAIVERGAFWELPQYNSPENEKFINDLVSHLDNELNIYLKKKGYNDLYSFQGDPNNKFKEDLVIHLRNILHQVLDKEFLKDKLETLKALEKITQIDTLPNRSPVKKAVLETIQHETDKMEQKKKDFETSEREFKSKKRPVMLEYDKVQEKANLFSNAHNVKTIAGSNTEGSVIIEITVKVSFKVPKKNSSNQQIFYKTGNIKESQDEDIKKMNEYRVDSITGDPSDMTNQIRETNRLVSEVNINLSTKVQYEANTINFNPEIITKSLNGAKDLLDHSVEKFNDMVKILKEEKN